VTTPSRPSAEPLRRRLSDAVAFALAFGVITGLGEAALLAAVFHVLHKPTFQGPFLMWMAPLGYILFDVVVATPLAVLMVRASAVAWTRTVVFVLALFTAWGPLILFQRLQLAASFILAAGVASQVARLAGRHADATRRWARPVAAGLVALALVLGLGLTAYRAARERMAVGTLPAAAGAPDVLVIVWDAVRAADLSVYGYERRTTPNLEALARRAVVFDGAVSPASWTLPSHAGLVTGRWANELSADWEVPIDGTAPTLGEILQRRGYRTAGFVANTHYLNREFGFSRGFQHYEDFVLSPGQVLMATTLGRTVAHRRWSRLLLGDEIPGRKTAAEIAGDFLHWLPPDSAHPFFAFLNVFDAHDPYLPPSPFREQFGAPSLDRLALYWPARIFSDSEIQQERNQYDGAIAYLDAQVGRLLDSLNARRLTRPLLLVITSDHGEEFGEHGYYSHGHSLYQLSIRVPLIMAMPGRLPEGVRVPGAVTLRDVPATILALADPARPRELPGRPLLPPGAAGDDRDTVYAEVRYSRNLPPRLPVSKGDVRGIMTGTHSYIVSGSGEELYDLTRDPGELTNLAPDSSAAPALARLRSVMTRYPAHPPPAWQQRLRRR
jgi:arylsulfatase A-like enzyme